MKLPQYRLLKISSDRKGTSIKAEWVDFVTCGECKYCGKDRIKWSEKDDNGNWIDTKFNACYVLADSKIGIKEVSLDDYCSWGVRKDDE